MNRLSAFRNIAVVVTCSLVAASCSDLTDEDNRLPDGTYPMTFTTQVEGTVTATRAATADGQWTVGDGVAVQVGSEVKPYTQTSISGNSATLQAASGTTPFYWQSTNDISVTAWYYGTGYSATSPNGASWTVQSDQSKTESGNADDNYQRSDFLYAPAKSIAFKPGDGADNSLSFYHQTAKVVINIKNAEAATDANAIQSVVIGASNSQVALSGSYTAPTDKGATAGTWNTSSGSPTMGTITPKRLTAPGTLAGGGTALASYAALVIPQQMKNKKFIAVTLTDGNTYYYTPKQDNEANLQSGKQHTYDITVKHGYLEVRASTGGSAWSSGESAEDVTGVQTFKDTDLKPGDYYYSDGNTSDGGYRKYSDGSTEIENIQPVLTDADGKERTVIGIVFWVGDATAQDKTLKAHHSDCTHGLVVALKDASESTAWLSSDVSVQDWLDSNQNGLFLAVQSGTGSSDPLNNIQGYNNTKAIEAFNASNSGNPVQAVAQVVAYRTNHATPANSSDWYLPSEKELTLLCGREVDNIYSNNSGGTANRDLINGKLSSISGAAQIVSSYYWSSTERDSYDAFDVDFDRGDVYYYNKDNAYRVRCALAF